MADGIAGKSAYFSRPAYLVDGSVRFDELAHEAAELETSNSPGDALESWLRDFVVCTRNYRGVTEVMAAAIDSADVFALAASLAWAW